MKHIKRVIIAKVVFFALALLAASVQAANDMNNLVLSKESEECLYKCIEQIDFEMLEKRDPQLYKIVCANEVNNIFRVAAATKYCKNESICPQALENMKEEVISNITNENGYDMFLITIGVNQDIENVDAENPIYGFMTIDIKLLDDLKELINSGCLYESFQEAYTPVSLTKTTDFFMLLHMHVVLNTDIIQNTLDKELMDRSLYNLGKLVDTMKEEKLSYILEFEFKKFNEYIQPNNNPNINNNPNNNNNQKLEKINRYKAIHSALNTTPYEYSSVYLKHANDRFLLDKILKDDRVGIQHSYSLRFLDYLHPIVRLSLLHNLEIKIVEKNRNVTRIFNVVHDQNNYVNNGVADNSPSVNLDKLIIQLASVDYETAADIISLDDALLISECNEIYVEVSQEDIKYLKLIVAGMLPGKIIYIIHPNELILTNLKTGKQETVDDIIDLYEAREIPTNRIVALPQNFPLAIGQLLVLLTNFSQKGYLGPILACLISLVAHMRITSLAYYGLDTNYMWLYRFISGVLLLGYIVDWVPLLTQTSDGFKYIGICRVLYAVFGLAAVAGLLFTFKKRTYASATVKMQNRRNTVKKIFLGLYWLLYIPIVGTLIFGSLDMKICFIYSKIVTILATYVYILSACLSYTDRDVLNRLIRPNFGAPINVKQEFIQFFRTRTMTDTFINILIHLTTLITLIGSMVMFITYLHSIPTQDIQQHLQFVFYRSSNCIPVDIVQ
ncbi:hypothetical protein NEAUS03_1802 [Nematocida ausubeli]|nr:hypothetical protein NEAUS03_1802 [Nematocida ausubeli]